MRLSISFVLATAVVAILGTTVARAADAPMACNVCTCQNDAVICVDGFTEVLEEQGVCGGPCSSIYSSFKSREFVETACEDLPACDHADTPAASPLWLSAGLVGLLLLGAATIRRVRTQH